MSVPIMAAVIASTLLLGAPVLAYAAGAVGGAKAGAAADAAALAGADAMVGLIPEAPDACEIAAEIVALNDAALVECAADDSRVEVAVTVQVRMGPVTSTRQARAGPASG